jgi:hypothetical protein
MPVNWHFNKKARMAQAIYEEWLTDLNRMMKKENCKILLLVDTQPVIVGQR